MIPGWILLLVSAGYVGVLFAVAYYGDRRTQAAAAPPRSRWLRPVVYSLALAVYCSSWTFYGAVGTAARTGLGFVPIYLGPLLMLAFGWRILERLVLISGEHRIVSIGDFLSSRYGRAPGLAARGFFMGASFADVDPTGRRQGVDASSSSTPGPRSRPTALITDPSNPTSVTRCGARMPTTTVPPRITRSCIASFLIRCREITRPGLPSWHRHRAAAQSE